MELTNLNKKISAIITGGASGMGAATARTLAALGVKVSIFDRQIDLAQQVANEIDGAAFYCDVSSAESVEQAFQQSEAAYGVSSILINCAGIATGERVVGREAPMALERFRQVIDINLIGTFNTLRVAAFKMANSETLTASGERGVIINTASVAAFDGQIGQAAYSASKGGIVGMTLPIARELARFGIRVMTIAPGIMETPMMKGMPEEVQSSLEKNIPFPARMGKPEEFAKLAIHIIENEYLNGEVIRLDAAIRMQPK